MTKFILFAAAFFGTATLISGQQTIFNVPTIDVLGHGQVYVEFDALFKPNASRTWTVFELCAARHCRRRR
ncbi:MAG: hypothetical protein IPP63_03085 [Chloracidobacterium sp.]|nr:hypothetical protein [Chloracidobacterium sp.]